MKWLYLLHGLNYELFFNKKKKSLNFRISIQIQGVEAWLGSSELNLTLDSVISLKLCSAMQ